MRLSLESRAACNISFLDPAICLVRCCIDFVFAQNTELCHKEELATFRGTTIDFQVGVPIV